MRKPDKVKPGTRILSAHHNAVVDQLGALQLSVGPGLIAQQTPNGTLISLANRVQDQQVARDGFFARITSATPRTDGIRWSYTFEKVEKSAGALWQAMTGDLALTGTATNGAEEPPSATQYEAVRTGSIVRMYKSSVRNTDNTITVLYTFYSKEQLADSTGPTKVLGYSVTAGSLNADTWERGVDQGGASVCIGYWAYASASGVAAVHERRLVIDKHGAVKLITGESLGQVIFTAENCP